MIRYKFQSCNSEHNAVKVQDALRELFDHLPDGYDVWISIGEYEVVAVIGDANDCIEAVNSLVEQ